MREPTQARSRERYRRILDAASALMAERSLEQLTVREIAAAAGVPTGTIYQFFDGKEGVLAVLGETFRAEMRALAARALAPAELRRDAAGAFLSLLAALASLQDRQGGFLCLARGEAASGAIGALAAGLRQELVAQIELALTGAYPARAEELRLFARVLSGVVFQVLSATPARDAPDRAAYLAEAATLLRTYVTTRLTAQP